MTLRRLASILPRQSARSATFLSISSDGFIDVAQHARGILSLNRYSELPELPLQPGYHFCGSRTRLIGLWHDGTRQPFSVHIAYLTRGCVDGPGGRLPRRIGTVVIAAENHLAGGG